MAAEDVSFNYRKAVEAYRKVPESQRKIISRSMRDVIASFPEGHLGKMFLEEALKQCDEDSLGALFVAGKIAKQNNLRVTNETMRILEDQDGHPVFYSICENMAKQQKSDESNDVRGLTSEQLSRRAILKRSVGFGASIVLGAEVFSELFGEFTKTNEQGKKELNKMKIGRVAVETIIATAAFVSGSDDKAHAEMVDIVNTIDGLVRAEIDKKRNVPAR